MWHDGFSATSYPSRQTVAPGEKVIHKISVRWMGPCRKFLVWPSNLEPAHLRQARWDWVYIMGIPGSSPGCKHQKLTVNNWSWRNLLAGYWFTCNLREKQDEMSKRSWWPAVQVRAGWWVHPNAAASEHCHRHWRPPLNDGRHPPHLPPASRT